MKSAPIGYHFEIIKNCVVDLNPYDYSEIIANQKLVGGNKS